MSVTEKEQVRTRFSDLDTQRHTTSRTYEDSCLGDRYRILEEAGYSWKRMIEESVRLQTVGGDIRFLAQQMENTELSIRTSYRSGQDGLLTFSQEVLDPNGKVAAEIKTLARTEKDGKPFQLIAAEATSEELISSFESIPSFSGSCERTLAERDLFYCERNPFGDYNPSHYWRLLEEGRWNFTAECGLSLEDLVAMDTTLFYMGGKIRYRKPLAAGRRAKIQTWIHSFDKIWSRMRQEVSDSETGEILAESMDDLLVVSVSKSRPKKPGEDLLKVFARVTEFPEGGSK
ncbi:thioesterase family protein [Leptospira johnsonii]|uniref:Thioesterase-like family protein n=1 Tax=Leptospira johnsonii TaxID=1917820 RepID=A0A2P2D6K9_9LEPT|nr:thioesterase family protein [Leptospira johnsonii]GBF40255.1 thioesterase-like family protein [Leptospira johnsonii]